MEGRKKDVDAEVYKYRLGHSLTRLDFVRVRQISRK